MKTDAPLKNDVEEELEWEPSVMATEIGVAARLRGYLDKRHGRRSARVCGG